MPFVLDAACGCSIGKVRKNNEDNFFFNGQCLEQENSGLPRPLHMEKPLWGRVLLAVFDGMGGENYGEAAAFSAANRLKLRLAKPIDFFVLREQFLNDLCFQMNNAVLARQEEYKTERIGTTVAMLALSRRCVYICNLGDSRVYSLQDSILTQLSEDHIERRREASARKAPLTQHLGIHSELFSIEPFITKKDLHRNDQYLICSDGLTDMLTDRDIADIMDHSDSAEQCVGSLIDAALDKGGKDNITAIVCRIH